jgi:type II secretory pathway pseudopilin PulG
MPNRKSEWGFALLLELMITCMVTTILMAMAVPAFMQMRAATYQEAAESQVRTIGRAQAAVALCSVSNCSAQAVVGLIPAPGTVQMQGYSFVMVGGANWTYTAVPLSTAAGHYQFYVDQSETVRCSLPPAVIDVTSPVCTF